MGKKMNDYEWYRYCQHCGCFGDTHRLDRENGIIRNGGYANERENYNKARNAEQKNNNK